MLIPAPSSIEYRNRLFTFGREVILTVSNSIDDIDILEELWENFTFGFGKLKINKIKTEKRIAVISTSAVDKIADEENSIDDYVYHITAKDNGIFIDYSDRLSLLYAFYTVLQLIEWEADNRFVIQSCDIYDKPVTEFRGIHICVFPETELEYIEKIIKLSAFFKISHIVLEFWGTLKYDALAELSWKSGFSKEQIKPLVQSAEKMGIKIIPMFNHLGHATQSRLIHGRHVVLDQNPKLQGLFEPDGWTWCISNPDTRNLLRKIRKELIDLFGNCGYFHLGCDEAYSFATCRRCSKYNKSDLLIEYLNSLADELAGYGIRGIVWGDQFLDSAEYKFPYFGSSDSDNETHKKLHKLSKKLIIADWQYDVKDKSKPILSSEYLHEKGFDVLLSPWYERENITALTLNAKKFYGVLGTTWHYLKEYFRIIPQTAAEAWSGSEVTNECILLANTARILRKLSSQGREYENCGFNNSEI